MKPKSNIPEKTVFEFIIKEKEVKPDNETKPNAPKPTLFLFEFLKECGFVMFCFVIFLAAVW